MVFNFLLFIGFILIPIINANEIGNYKSSILKSISANYDKRIRPNDEGPPVEVGVTMYVLSIPSISEVQMDFTLDFYFRQFWNDPRLAFQKQYGIEKITLGSDFIRNIWVPDTFFANSKTSYFHTMTTNNELLNIGFDGNVSRSMRLTMTASCPMNLLYFPMDRQLCAIEIESFGYSMKDIKYKWDKGSASVGVSNEVSLPHFKVIGHRVRKMEISLSTGNYSRLACEFQFVRSMGYYLLQTYIPAALIVIISWVNFWINCNATATRVLLSVICALTMITLMTSMNATLPKISYIKAIDKYLGICFVMVFASLLEYAAVSYMAKRMQMRKKRFPAMPKLQVEKNSSQNDSENSIPIPKQTEIKYKYHQNYQDEEIIYSLYPDENSDKTYRLSPRNIDKYSSILFPVCFICFNLMYWIIYLRISDKIADNLIILE